MYKKYIHNKLIWSHTHRYYLPPPIHSFILDLSHPSIHLLIHPSWFNPSITSIALIFGWINWLYTYHFWLYRLKKRKCISCSTFAWYNITTTDLFNFRPTDTYCCCSLRSRCHDDDTNHHVSFISFTPSIDVIWWSSTPKLNFNACGKMTHVSTTKQGTITLFTCLQACMCQK